MNRKKSSRRVRVRVYKTVRILVRTAVVCALLLASAFIFLLAYGVPDPLLRIVLHRINAAGVPVAVDSVKLTLRGWQAQNLRCYSSDPDDLQPIFYAQEVMVNRRQMLEEEHSSLRSYGIVAYDADICPPMGWGVEVPGESVVRTVDNLRLSIEFFSDRVEISDGAFEWLGTRFKFGGRVLHTAAVLDSPEPGAEKPPTEYPTMRVTAGQFEAFEDYLELINLQGEAEVDINFLVDAGNPVASRVDCSLKATDIHLQDITFEAIEVAGFFQYPEVRVHQALFDLDGQECRIEGSYNVDSKEVQGRIKNGITSARLFSLLPDYVYGFMELADINFEYLPKFALTFDPARPEELLNALSGSFSINNVTFHGLLIESLGGNISRSDNLLELTKLKGAVAGQEERAEEVGSCMVGGSAEGSVFWNADTEEFGVTAKGSFDPNLVMGPLSMVRIATNVIDRFKFPEQPPQISLELGSSYVDWSTFFIDIQGTGSGVKIHDGLLSSVNVSAFYKRGILRLEPFAAMDGSRFFKGTASLDFKQDSVTFDAFGSIHPQLIEDAVYSKFNLFGNKIKTSGDVDIKARGTLEWATMLMTDFEADVEAEHLEIPVARMDDFSGRITGLGPQISVSGAEYGIYGGEGTAEFSILLDPATNAMPYEMEIDIKKASFVKCLQFLKPDINDEVGGKMKCSIAYTADMAQNFFESANGSGTVSVTDGKLADLRFFGGFSWLMRKVVPGFSFFSITSIDADFKITDGVISSKNAHFGGDLISAQMTGKYSSDGFDAKVQAQVLSEHQLTRFFHVLTKPIFRLFKMRLEGTLENPEWRLDKFTVDSSENDEESR